MLSEESANGKSSVPPPLRPPAAAAPDAGYFDFLDAGAFARMLEAGGDPLVILDSAWRYVYINEPALPFMPRPRGEMLGRTMPEMLPEIVDTPFWEVFQRAKREQAFLVIEDYFAPLKTWFDIRVFPYDDHLYLYFRDTTAAHRAEAAASVSRERIASLLESMDEAFVSIDRDWIITNVNGVAARAFGAPPEEMIGRRYWELWPFLRGTDAEMYTRRALEEQVPVHYERFSELTHGWVEARLYPVPAEDGGGVHVFFRDITERKRAEAELLRAEAELERRARNHAALVQSATDSLARYDRDLRFVYVNPAFERYTGYSFEQVQGKTLREVGFPPESYEAWEPTFRQVFATGEPMRTEVTVHRPGDGELRCFERVITPEFDPAASGEVVTILTFSRDITDRKHIEQRERFLADLTDRISVLDPEEVLYEAARAAAEYAGVDRSLYGLIDDDAKTITIPRDFVQGEGVQSIQGTYPLGSFAAEIIESLRRGSITSIEDIETDPRVSDEHRDLFRRLNFRSFLCVPMHKNGKWVAVLVLHHAAPRRWTRDDEVVLRTVTERTWLAVENARLFRETRIRAEREALINQIGDGIRLALPPDEIEALALRALGEALHVDRAYLMRIDLDRDLLAVSRDWSAPGVQTIAGQFRISDLGVDFAALFAGGQSLVLPDLRPQSERRLSDQNAEMNEKVGVSALINVPYIDDGRIVGALAVAMADGPRDWTEEEITLVETVAGQLRWTVESARQQQRERNIAQHLQEALQPPVPEAVPGLALASYYHAALGEAEVGGDFHDVVDLGGGRTALVVADLAGKGLNAASQVSLVRNQLRYALYTADLDRSGALAAALQRLNHVLSANCLLTGFATLFVGIWNGKTGELRYVNAGQEPALIWRAAGGDVESLPPTGPVLGGFDTGTFEEKTAMLSPGDIWAAFTDGMTEIGPSRRNLLGIEGVVPRFTQSCREATESAAAASAAVGTPEETCAVVSPSVVLSRLIASVEEFAGTGGRRDDLCTLVGVCRPLSPEEEIVAAAEPAEPSPPSSLPVAASEAAGLPHGSLQSLTAALLEVVTPSDVVKVVIERGMATLGASAGLVALVNEDGDALEVARTSGYSDRTMEGWHRIPLTDRVPLADVVRDGRPLLIRSRDEWLAVYPDLMPRIKNPNVHASISLPLAARRRVFGALHFSFPGDRAFTDADRAFLDDLSRQCALALDRARLLESAEASRDEAREAGRRVQFLAEAGALLGETLEYQKRLEALARLCVPEFADWAAVDILDEQGDLVRLAVAHRDPARESAMRALQDRQPPDHHSGTMRVIETGERLFHPHIAAELIEERAAIDPEQARLIREVGIEAILSLPLSARGRNLGALTLGMGPRPVGSGRAFDEETVSLAEELARRAGIAIDSARIVAELEQRNARQRASLEQSEERFRLMVEGVRDYAIFMLDPEGYIATWNLGAERLKGYTANEIIGKHFSTFYTPEDIARRHPWNELEIAIREGRYEEEGWRVRKDGTRFWANVVITALRDKTGELRGFAKVTRDVTERKLRDEERASAQVMEQQRRLLRDILASVTQGRLTLCDSLRDLPAPLAPEAWDGPIALSRRALKAVRDRVRDVAGICGLANEPTQDIITGASEGAMNAVQHAGGGIVRVYGDPNRHRVQVWIEDEGRGIDLSHLPRATLEAGYSTGGGGIGHGFSLMIATCQRVYLLTGATGTTVVLEQERETPEPSWLRSVV